MFIYNKDYRTKEGIKIFGYSKIYYKKKKDDLFKLILTNRTF